MPTPAYWPADTSAQVWHQTPGDVLAQAALTAGERTALVEVIPPGMSSVTGMPADRRWTYAALYDDALACAHWLATRFAPGEPICLWAQNAPEWVIVQYGAALAGLVLVTANPSLRADELRHVLDQSGARALIHAAAFRGTDMAAIAAEATGFATNRIPLDTIPAALAAHRGAAADDLPTVSPGAPSQMQFTSGTTGRPKGALLRHSSLVTNAAFVAARIGQVEDVVVSPMPLFHTAGSVLGVLGAATTRSTLVLPLAFDPATMLRAIAAERGTVVAGVPTMLSALIDELGREAYDTSSLRVAYSAGAPIAPELLARVERSLGCTMVSVYGQTELSPIVCATGSDDTSADRAASAGRPLPQVEVPLVDPHSGAVVARGEEGEVQARGYQTMIGYHGLPDATAATLLPDGWLRTGDLGRMDARGMVTITGRLSDMIIRGGRTSTRPRSRRRYYGILRCARLRSLG